MSEPEDPVQELADFMDELPTLRCGEGGCSSCSAAHKWSCAPIVPGPERDMRAAAWEEKTEPRVPPNFDDDYLFVDDVGGESG